MPGCCFPTCAPLLIIVGLCTVLNFSVPQIGFLQESNFFIFEEERHSGSAETLVSFLKQEFRSSWQSSYFAKMNEWISEWHPVRTGGQRTWPGIKCSHSFSSFGPLTSVYVATFKESRTCISASYLEVMVKEILPIKKKKKRASLQYWRKNWMPQGLLSIYPIAQMVGD